MIFAEPRNFARAIAPRESGAWATRRYAVPRVQHCGDGALPTLQIGPVVIRILETLYWFPPTQWLLCDAVRGVSTALLAFPAPQNACSSGEPGLHDRRLIFSSGSWLA